MSEIATGILHNVGNVLNSVNISASLVSQRVEGMSIGDLRKGDVVRLACKGASVTVTSPNGAQTELTSTVFHSALVATFTDEKAVSEEARDNIGAALAAL